MDSVDTRQTEWHPIPSTDYERMSVEVLTLILSHAEKLLHDTLEVRRSTESKANTLIATLTPTIFALFAVVSGIVRSPTMPIGTHNAALVGLLLLLAALFLCVAVVNPSKRYRIGSLPKDLFEPTWTERYEDGMQLKFYLIKEINSHQIRGVENLSRSATQANIVTGAISLIVAAPVFSGAVLLFACVH